jgi:hypothetical protein
MRRNRLSPAGRNVPSAFFSSGSRARRATRDLARAAPLASRNPWRSRARPVGSVHQGRLRPSLVLPWPFGGIGPRSSYGANTACPRPTSLLMPGLEQGAQGGMRREKVSAGEAGQDQQLAGGDQSQEQKHGSSGNPRPRIAMAHRSLVTPTGSEVERNRSKTMPTGAGRLCPQALLIRARQPRSRVRAELDASRQDYFKLQSG